MSSQILNKNDLDSRQLDVLITPSWQSGLLVIVASLALVLGVIISLHYHGSEWELLTKLQSTNTHVVGTTSEAAKNNLIGNTLVSDIPLFIFWAGIGLIAYSFTTALIDAVRNVENIRAEMGYLHVDRHALIRTAVLRLVLRVAFLIAWLLYIRLSVHVIVPYVIAVAFAATGPVGWIAAAGYVLWAIFLMAACLHLHVIMVRLLALRPRLFGQAS